MDSIQKYIEYIQSLGVDVSHTQLAEEHKKTLETAFTHKSYSMDAPQKSIPHQERLEFLGDAILGAVIADILHHNHNKEQESGLTLAKISLVREEYLAEVARHIGLGEYIRVGVGEERSGGRDKDSVLSDSLEAIIAAIYLMKGRQSVYDFIKTYVYVSPETLTPPTKNQKNQLQEYCQKEFRILPEYIDEVLEAEESGNITLFGSTVYIGGEKYGEGSGTSKRKAQENAASKSLELLHI